MKLATLRNGSRDGALIIVDDVRAMYAEAGDVALSLQAALDRWSQVEAPLRARAEALQQGRVRGVSLDMSQLQAPLPRAYEWIDGSAFLNHIELVRKARGAEIPPTLQTDPLVYQGGSGVLMGPTDPMPLVNPEWGLDFEAEVAVILGDTPRGTAAAHAGDAIRLVMLVNDWTYRNLIPAELAKGFGFFCSKPATAFSPFAVTPDELGAAWHSGRVHLDLCTTLNGKRFGAPNAGAEMHFSFCDLIAHVTKSRALTAGTILGSGTVSNRDRTRGSSCLVEARMIETIEQGKPRTPYLQFGDRVEIEMYNADGRSVFGKIAEDVV